MAHQSPMISIPKKTTEEVDWTTPIRTLIAQSYGESPDNYTSECQALMRCRQDAVRGAGSDMTARDLLYKYFGQLELLELRFSEIRVNFPWHDAFTNKLITQTSIAYEKASILFQIAVTHSAIAASQNRSDPEGLKRSFYYFRTCAGMLTYVNENFLHAPSTDLSRDVVKFLINVILAQATEVFFEKCTEEKKGNALVSKVGAQAASMYNALAEEVKEFMGKGIFDRNWVSLIQIKAKYFTSLAQYYRGLADDTAGKHGDALVRFTLAETLAKEASRLAQSFSGMFVTAMSPNLPSDAGTSIADRLKAHLAVCSERKGEAHRENDLIYNAVLCSPDALPAIDKTTVATPIPIHDVYGAPDVQKVIGPDLFVRLIPLSVHESASVYSEEKAKLVRGEVENAEVAETEVKSALDSMGVKEGLSRFKAMADGEVGGEEEVPVEVRRWIEDINVVESKDGVAGLFGELNRLKDDVKRDLEGISHDLDVESRECEMMRVRYEHLWTQEPSGSLVKPLRQDLKSHFQALDAAAMSDQQVIQLWESCRGDIGVLLSPQIEEVFRASTERGGRPEEHLLDLDVSGTEADDGQERVKIGRFVNEIEERLGRLNKITHERNEVLKDLKEKIQTDDVSHLLLLNRRNTGVEPALFAAELEKFKPYQQRLASSVHHQQATIQELQGLWKSLKDLAGRGPGAKKWDEREKRKKETIRRFQRARDGYMEVRDGLAKGLQFYRELTELGGTLKTQARSFVASRASERESLAGQAETQKRLSAPSAPPPLAEKPRVPPPPPKPPAPTPNLDASFASMSLRGNPTSPPPGQWSSPPSQAQHSAYTPSYQSQLQQQPSLPLPPSPPSQPPYASSPPQNYFPPPPTQQPHPPKSQPSYASAPPQDPYASLAAFGSQFSIPQPPPPAPPQQPQQLQQSYVPQRQQSYPPPPPQQQQYPGQYQQQQQPSPAFPPPPPPVSYQYGAPSPQQQPGQQGQYQQFSPPQQGYGQQGSQYNQYNQGYGR